MAAIKVNRANNWDAICRVCGEEKASALIAYLECILEINESINLTAIRDFQDACVLHLEDSLVATPEIMATIDGAMCDIGTGGGFPGVPLAVATGRPSTLVDSRTKKINAVTQAIQKSKIDTFAKISGEASRIEDFGKQQSGKFAVVTARALSALPTILELATPLLQKGGSLVALKSEIADDEEEWGTRLAPKLGLELESKRRLTLSDKQTKRVIYSFKKISESKIKLPRKVGLAQKQPLLP